MQLEAKKTRSEVNADGTASPLLILPSPKSEQREGSTTNTVSSQPQLLCHRQGKLMRASSKPASPIISTSPKSFSLSIPIAIVFQTSSFTPHLCPMSTPSRDSYSHVLNPIFFPSPFVSFLKCSPVASPRILTFYPV